MKNLIQKVVQTFNLFEPKSSRKAFSVLNSYLGILGVIASIMGINMTHTTFFYSISPFFYFCVFLTLAIFFLLAIFKKMREEQGILFWSLIFTSLGTGIALILYFTDFLSERPFANFYFILYGNIIGNILGVFFEFQPYLNKLIQRTRIPKNHSFFFLMFLIPLTLLSTNVFAGLSSSNFPNAPEKISIVPKLILSAIFIFALFLCIKKFCQKEKPLENSSEKK